MRWKTSASTSRNVGPYVPLERRTRSAAGPLTRSGKNAVAKYLADAACNHQAMDATAGLAG